MRTLWLLPFHIGLVVSAACSPSEPAHEDEAAALAGIERHNQAVEEALSSGDVDALMAEIVDDAVWLPPGQGPVLGKEAIREFKSASRVDYLQRTERSSSWVIGPSFGEYSWAPSLQLKAESQPRLRTRS
jgi:hypothetical protein